MPLALRILIGETRVYAKFWIPGESRLRFLFASPHHV